MFLFGFLGVFVITQMHGLGLSRLVRAAVIIGYLIAVVAVYAVRGLAGLPEVIRIPSIEYALVFLVAGLIWLARVDSSTGSPSPSRGPGRAHSPDRAPSPNGRVRRGTRPDR